MRTATLSMGHLYFCSDPFTFNIHLSFTTKGVNMTTLLPIFTKDEWSEEILFEYAKIIIVAIHADGIPNRSSSETLFLSFLNMLIHSYALRCGKNNVNVIL
jgi:hypothetical protein